MGLQLAIHRVGRVELIVANLEGLLDDVVLATEVLVRALHAVEVARLRGVLRPH